MGKFFACAIALFFVPALDAIESMRVAITDLTTASGEHCEALVSYDGKTRTLAIKLFAITPANQRSILQRIGATSSERSLGAQSLGITKSMVDFRDSFPGFTTFGNLFVRLNGDQHAWEHYVDPTSWSTIAQSFVRKLVEEKNKKPAGHTFKELLEIASAAYNVATLGRTVEREKRFGAEEFAEAAEKLRKEREEMFVKGLGAFGEFSKQGFEPGKIEEIFDEVDVLEKFAHALMALEGAVKPRPMTDVD